jgi:uncharacterized membrane protein YgcG
VPRRRAAPWLAALGALLLAAPAHARDWPRPTGHFNDLAHAVEPAYRDSIEAVAREVRETIGSQIAVLVTPDLGGETSTPRPRRSTASGRSAGRERTTGS